MLWCYLSTQILSGDRILIQPVGAETQRGRWFEGCVHVVHKEEVGMKLDPSFHRDYIPSKRYRIRFKLNRSPIQRQHQALDAHFTLPRILFPTPTLTLKMRAPAPDAIREKIHNKLIRDNPAQLQAVSSIAQLPAGCPPFVVFGP